MGGLRGRRASNNDNHRTGNEYPDDGARPMPSFNSPWYREAARDKRLAISAQSGRTSTSLAGSTPGLRTYVNNYLGSTG